MAANPTMGDAVVDLDLQGQPAAAQHEETPPSRASASPPTSLTANGDEELEALEQVDAQDQDTATARSNPFWKLSWLVELNPRVAFAERLCCSRVAVRLLQLFRMATCAEPTLEDPELSGSLTQPPKCSEALADKWWRWWRWRWLWG